MSHPTQPEFGNYESNHHASPRENDENRPLQMPRISPNRVIGKQPVPQLQQKRVIQERLPLYENNDIINHPHIQTEESFGETNHYKQMGYDQYYKPDVEEIDDNPLGDLIFAKMPNKSQSGNKTAAPERSPYRMKENSQSVSPIQPKLS